ncbi:caffeic acid 3-O-methyltransferase-like isoform X2 [Syzygium oleosum]|uniref:caffeic acid 3-O-methyltransferase-like isoform X2 n=1 Tax=Syzygium oleosum TaxID=219896 RepID=UPI0024B8FD00|nr:caffeic acid 3-O-methyltransferase-like isoform X2 [Syzygium oleosum]
MDKQKMIAIDKEDESSSSSIPLYAMQLATSSVLPMVLKATVELGVLDILEREGPGAMLSPSQIASKIPVRNNPGAHGVLDQMLSLLASHSILSVSLGKGRQGDGGCRVYGLAPVAQYFLRNQEGDSLSDLMFMVQDRVMIDFWFHLKDAVLEGGVPFERAHGMNAVSYLQKDARFSEIFKNSMKEYNKLFMSKIFDVYKGFEGLNSLVDVGGGDGSILSMIISKYPHIKAINFDQASVIEKSPSYSGIEYIAGDMFVSIPKGDAIFIKWVLHMFDDEHCIKILKNCYDALPDNGKVMAVDLVIPEAPEANLAARSLFQMYVFMRNMNPMGKERTEKEFETLAKEAGFCSIRVAYSAHNFSLVELYKNAKFC